MLISLIAQISIPNLALQLCLRMMIGFLAITIELTGYRSYIHASPPLPTLHIILYTMCIALRYSYEELK